jgi:hypothetical protein
MGYADPHDDLGIEGTGIFPALGQPPRSGGHPSGSGRPWAAPPGRYAQAGSYPAGFPASQALAMPPVRGQGRRERLRRMRPDRWVIAIGSITGAVAVYVAFTTATAPARPMPSPFAPVATHSAPASAIPPQMAPAAAATCGAPASGGATSGH